MPAWLVIERDVCIVWHGMAFLDCKRDGYHSLYWTGKSQDEQHLVPASVFPFPFLISSLFPRSVCSWILSPDRQH